jgi:TolB-like protein/Flp pilus assembly protein TadD/predicted Ser/Thr protein kinase
MFLPVGTILGRYEIRSLLGKGGMGEVYLAQDTNLRRLVAIKLLPVAFTQSKERLHRFEREAFAASSLNHPNILTVHEIGAQDDRHFIATEYIEGESLRQRMTRAPVELREALDVAIQIASALAATHGAGIVHRDIKPENIMLRRDGFVKVLDFGLAKLADEKAARRGEADTEAPTEALINTAPGLVVGTPCYMSPEQARDLETDARTDIWSLGVVLYEMFAGRLPFQGETATDVLATILHREPPSLLLYHQGVPEELERIVEKALTKGREERYQTAKDLGVDLKRLKQRSELEAELERSTTPEEEARRVSMRAATGGSRPPVAGATRAVAAQTVGGDVHATSSAEYITAGIRRHKRGAALVLATLLLAITGLAYFYSVRGGRAAINSVAVMPFVNETADPDAEYLSDGISESLINNLSQLPQLKVIARSSTFKYKGKEVDPEEVAKALGVQAIVTGRVVERGDELQISVELVNALDKTQMWGEQYNRRATDLQAVQAEMARAISEKLRLRLTGGQEQQLTKRATANPQAYQLYLTGVFYGRKRNIEGTRKALDYFNQAVALDPNFALAFAGMPTNYANLALFSVLAPKEALAKGEAAAQKALELDETPAEAHNGLARIKEFEWDWSGAEREYKRAIELNPNLAAAHRYYAGYLASMGRITEALDEDKREGELDPLSVKENEAEVLFLMRRYDEAIQALQDSIKSQPDYAYAHLLLGFAYEAKGMYAEAVNEYQKVISIDGETTSTLCYLGYSYAMWGKRDEALAILNKLKMTKEYVSPAELATLYVGLGDKEAAFQSLERAYSEHDLNMQYLKNETHYDPLRSDPHFTDLMRRVGLSP